MQSIFCYKEIYLINVRFIIRTVYNRKDHFLKFLKIFKILKEYYFHYHVST